MNLKKAAFINAIGKYSVVIIQLFVTAVLSRLLSPEDYGVVAVVTVFSTFFSMLANVGFGTAIIQNKELTNEDINNIYSFTVYLGLALSVLFAVFSFPIAWFYKENLYIPVTMILSISLFFGTLNMVPNGILNRDKKFTAITVRTIIVYAAAAAIAIILAFLGLRYYALVIQTILSAFFAFLWNYLSTRPKFLPKFQMESIKKIANYSSYQFAFNFVNYFAGNLDNLLTGKFFGSAQLGYYNKAYNLLLYPINNLAGVVSPVLHPILSDYQSDKKLLYYKYIKVLKLLALLGAYVQAVCHLAGYELITIMFGEQWQSSVICFEMLSFCIIFRMVNSTSGALFQSLGNTKMLFQNGLINTLLSIISILIGIFAFGNIQGLSVCVAIAYILHYMTASFMLIKGGFSLSLLQYYKDIKEEVILFFIMLAASFADILHIENVYLSLSIKVGYLTIIFMILLFATKEYKIFLSLIKRKK